MQIAFVFDNILGMDVRTPYQAHKQCIDQHEQVGLERGVIKQPFTQSVICGCNVLPDIESKIVFHPSNFSLLLHCRLKVAVCLSRRRVAIAEAWHDDDCVDLKIEISIRRKNSFGLTCR